MKVDRRGIGLTPNGDHWTGGVDLLFVQKDDAGRQYGGQDVRVDLNLSRATYDKLMQQGLIYKKPIALDTRLISFG